MFSGASRTVQRLQRAHTVKHTPDGNEPIRARLSPDFMGLLVRPGASHGSHIRFNIQWNLIMAGSLMAVIPCVVLYFFTQRYIVGGIASVGIKG